MKLLLDTHALIWFANDDEKLPASIKNLLENAQNTCAVSLVSFWEMALKLGKGSLKLEMTLTDFYQLVIDNNIEILTIEFEHIKVLQNLEEHHKDPFDRMIISQAKSDDWTIISKDRFFQFYPVKVLWE